MSVSKLLPASGNNDFNVAITGTYTVVTFTKEYSAGSYTLTSSLSDTTYDIYVFNSDGSSAGYSKTPSLTATKGFNKMVVLGGSVGDLLSFVYKTTYTSADETAEVGAGPVIASVSPTDMPNVDSTITVTGRNFATDVTISFTNTGYASTAAKNIVRSSATSLIVTRPDVFPIATSAYTITASNPGVTNPTGTNANILATSVTAGNAPVWSTTSPLPVYTKNVAYSTTLVATDSSDPGSAITYSIVSGLPTGLTLASTSGVLSGTSTSSVPLTSIVVRATDSGGNFVDRTFTIPNKGPVWTTTGALTNATSGSAYTYTLLAPDDSGTTPTFALVSGALPTGLTLAATSGVISGTPTVTSNGTSSTFVISATDANGSTTNSGTLSLYVLGPVTVRFTSSSNWVAPTSVTSITYALAAGGAGGGAYFGSGNVGSGGGGAGGVLYSTMSVTPGTSYSFTIGGGGAGAQSRGFGSAGSNSSFAAGLTAFGGSGGGPYGDTPAQGGSGGGGCSSLGGAGTAGQGNAGGQSTGQYSGGGGGGAGSAGAAANGGQNTNGGAGGNGANYLGYSIAGGGGGGVNADPSSGTGGLATFGGGRGGFPGNAPQNATENSSGGGGGSNGNLSQSGGNGAGGSIIIQYLG